MRIEALSMGDLPPKREGYVYYVATHHKVADRLRKQLSNDLVSASRGVDDGKDLHQYAERHFRKRWDCRMRRWSIWRLMRCKWRGVGGPWYSKVYRMFVGVEEGRVWPKLG